MQREHRLIVRNQGGWTIAYGVREFERFRTRDDATMTALQWASNAERQGLRARVLIEDERGQLHPVIGHS